MDHSSENNARPAPASFRARNARWPRYLLAATIVAVSHYVISLIFICTFSQLRYVEFRMSSWLDDPAYALFVAAFQFPMSWIGASPPDDMFDSRTTLAGFCAVNALFWGITAILCWRALWKLDQIGGRLLDRFTARAGTCRKCGYDLRGTPLRCPECGTAPPRGMPD